ncbi:hypothetical protein LTR94_003815 [Friedmanniomyces endolithicus]|nr:hypothetical protein LTR94_003815 [Friedmanniomyces endolithicus]
MAPLRNRSALSGHSGQAPARYAPIPLAENATTTPNRPPHPFASSEVEKPIAQRILQKPFALSLSKPVLSACRRRAVEGGSAERTRTDESWPHPPPSFPRKRESIARTFRYPRRQSDSAPPPPKRHKNTPPHQPQDHPMTDWLSMLQDHWAWLVFAALLAIAEVLIPGVFLIWIAIAAAITGLAALALPIGIPLQLLIFAALCVVSVWAGRRWYVDNPVPSTDPNLNDRTARLIGELVTVVEPIRGGEGRVKVGDSVWTARGPDSEAGTRVRVTGAEGAVLWVEGT